VTVDFSEVVAPAVDALAIPGAAVGVFDAGNIETWCTGVTSVEDPLPVTDTTIFQIGSISKTFVGTAAMKLVAAGALDLDEPVRTYVPDLRLSSPELTDAVTMRHLLTHTSGWVGDYFGHTGYGDDALARFVVKLAKAPQLTPLGALYSYNNTAFNLAAHVVACVAEQPYERVVRSLILQPLGMGLTCFSAEEAINHRVAIGHRKGRTQPWGRARAFSGAGGVLSCVRDLLAYARFHLGGEMDEMQAVQRDAGSLCDWVGLVWMLDEYGGARVVHHGGTTNGYMADLKLVPSRDLAWLMLTNSGDHEHQLDRVIQAELLGPDPQILVGYEPARFDEYVGRYEAVLADLTVREGDQGLVLEVATPRRAMWNPDEDPDPPRSTRLQFRGADVHRVIAVDQPFTGHRGEFVRGPDGRGGDIAFFRWDGRLARRVGS
jgi:CubicO group peptidase (beta-lactamase class C family)